MKQALPFHPILPSSSVYKVGDETYPAGANYPLAGSSFPRAPEPAIVPPPTLLDINSIRWGRRGGIGRTRDGTDGKCIRSFHHHPSAPCRPPARHMKIEISAAERGSAAADGAPVCLPSQRDGQPRGKGLVCLTYLTISSRREDDDDVEGAAPAAARHQINRGHRRGRASHIRTKGGK